MPLPSVADGYPPSSPFRTAAPFFYNASHDGAIPAGFTLGEPRFPGPSGAPWSGTRPPSTPEVIGAAFRAAAADPDSRICIVGAGPAGITAALDYRRLGLEKIVLLESQDRVAGRCRTTPDGTDLGAVAWVPGYRREVVEFTDRLGIARAWVPRLVTLSRSQGGICRQQSLAQKLLSYAQAARCIWDWRSWQGVADPDCSARKTP